MTNLHRRSLEYQVIAEFPDRGSVIFIMTKESAALLPGSLGNVIFAYHAPLLRLRDSDQKLLLAALKGDTGAELSRRLGITPAAVKGSLALCFRAH